MLKESPTEVIKAQYEEGGRAMVFVQYVAKINGVEIPIEIQIVPQSVEEELHRQRINYLLGRYLGYRVTANFLKELLEKDKLDPYIV